MRPRFTLALAFVLAGSLSCSNNAGPSFVPVVPRADIRVTIEATPLTGQAGQPVMITARLKNQGTVSVLLLNRCPEPTIRIYDAQSEEMFQRDPTQPIPCPTSLYAPLEPGQDINVPLTFAGSYYSYDGQLHQVPAGPYDARALFMYSEYRDSQTVGDPQTASRDVLFNWQ